MILRKSLKIYQIYALGEPTIAILQSSKYIAIQIPFLLGKLDPKYLLRREGMSIGIMKQIVPPATNEAYISPIISAEGLLFFARVVVVVLSDFHL